MISICYITDNVLCKTPTEFPDIDKSGYVSINGNSAASAIVTGVIALMLEANPELTWRDIKYILANTAKVGDIENMAENRAGYKFDEKNSYGFGIIDAEAAVKMANTYKKELGDLEVKKTPEVTSTNVIDEKEPTSKIEFTIHEDINIEAITLSYKVKFYPRSDSAFKNLRMTVTPPTGLFKLITIPSYPSSHEANGPKITLNHFYGESAKGNWRFDFKHSQDPEYIENITMTMTIYGTKEDISKTANP
jgi:subtilisin-like proprotein convertase family protein